MAVPSAPTVDWATDWEDPSTKPSSVTVSPTADVAPSVTVTVKVLLPAWKFCVTDAPAATTTPVATLNVPSGAVAATSNVPGCTIRKL